MKFTGKNVHLSDISFKGLSILVLIWQVNLVGQLGLNPDILTKRQCTEKCASSVGNKPSYYVAI